MRRPKRRREGEIVRVELGDAHGWTAPFVYGKGDLPRALRIEAECDAQAVEFRRRREIEVQLSRFGDESDPRGAARETQHGKAPSAPARWGGPPGLPSSQRSFPTARKAGGPTNGVG